MDLREKLRVFIIILRPFLSIVYAVAGIRFRDSNLRPLAVALDSGV